MTEPTTAAGPDSTARWERTRITRPVLFEAVDQVNRNGDPHRIWVTLRFDSIARFEVTLTFPGERPEWVISRDLLIDGIAHNVGLGDVRITPDEPYWTVITFHGQEGTAGFRMSRKDLIGFLADTVNAGDIVPELTQWMTEIAS